MGAEKVIRLSIAFLVFYLLFFLLQPFVLPPLKVFLPALPPTILWTTLYSLIKTGMHMIFPVIIVVMLMLWAIHWFIVNILMKIPIIGQIIGAIILKISPFPELEETGVFSFIDSSIDILMSFDPIGTRLKRFGRAFADFAGSSVGFIMSTAQDAFGGVGTKVQSTTQSQQDSTGPSPQEVRSQEAEDTCYLENSVPEDPSAGLMDSLSTKLKNNSASVKCKISSLQSTFSNINVKV
jgi:hypothetical protein